VNDLTGGGRPGTQEDFRRFVKLGHVLNVIGFFGGYPVEPQDLPAPTRHLDCIADFLTLTDKVFHPYCLGATRIRDALELIRLGRGLTEGELHAGPQCYTVVNSSSPLRYDAPMLDGMIEMARANQCICLTPFTLAGAMAPITLAGALAQQNAETLAGIVFAQMVRRGTPVIYGAYTSNVDMRTGAPAMGTPEYLKAALISGQLARRLWPALSLLGRERGERARRAGGLRDDLRALGCEARAGGHRDACGGLARGRAVGSPEKLVIDAEILQGLNAALSPSRSATTRWRSTRSARSGPAGISSARRIRCALHEPSTGRSCRTGRTSARGRRRAAARRWRGRMT
jgi:trimethylamine---corrinoid protein Co-methyltransferase